MPATIPARPGSGLFRITFYGIDRQSGRLLTRGYNAPGNTPEDIARAEVRARRQLRDCRFVIALPIG